jgi:glycosyltransferase involved in cell wall biosynthesis
MENAILKLLKNDDLCEEIAQKGWEFVQKFNDNVIANQLILVYNRIKNE